MKSNIIMKGSTKAVAFFDDPDLFNGITGF